MVDATHCNLTGCKPFQNPQVDEKLGLSSWFINQPSCYGPKRPLPDHTLEGAAGRNWTHVKPPMKDIALPTKTQIQICCVTGANLNWNLDCKKYNSEMVLSIQMTDYVQVTFLISLSWFYRLFAMCNILTQAVCHIYTIWIIQTALIHSCCCSSFWCSGKVRFWPNDQNVWKYLQNNNGNYRGWYQPKNINILIWSPISTKKDACLYWVINKASCLS